MNEVLNRWNRLPEEEAEREVISSCGSRSWGRGIVGRRPFADGEALLAAADEVSQTLGRPDWLEAFQSHPRIGASAAERPVAPRAEAWSRQEQRGVALAGEAVKLALADGNRAYERKFGHIFIVCAAGKSASEILEILRRRLQNEKEPEFSEAAEQHRQIARLRLRKWLGL
jgi:2-oxo-4-hydroxy-4-carboxy-5-ureidoimidazoline decarboxylase